VSRAARRLRQAAMLGAGIAAVPVIRSIIAPSAAMAASTACVAHGDPGAGQSCCAKSGRGVFCTASSLCRGTSSHYNGLCSGGSQNCKLGHVCGNSSSSLICVPG
jgi:hypothetical protein